MSDERASDAARRWMLSGSPDADGSGSASGARQRRWSPSAVMSQWTGGADRSGGSLGQTSQSSAGQMSDGSSSSVSDQLSSRPAALAPGTKQRELPPLFFQAEPEDLITLISDMLSRLMAHNDCIPLQPTDLTRFHSRATPAISVGSYLRRIAKYTTLDKPCMLLILIYIDRVSERMAGFTICSLTVHRFVCAAVVCASKGLCDSFSTNTHYARVGGISLVELNMLEKEFLNAIDWRLMVTAPLMQQYYASLVQMHPNYTLRAGNDPLPTAFPAFPGSSDTATHEPR